MCKLHILKRNSKLGEIALGSGNMIKRYVITGRKKQGIDKTKSVRITYVLIDILHFYGI